MASLVSVCRRSSCSSNSLSSRLSRLKKENAYQQQSRMIMASFPTDNHINNNNNTNNNNNKNSKNSKLILTKSNSQTSSIINTEQFNKRLQSTDTNTSKNSGGSSSSSSSSRKSGSFRTVTKYGLFALIGAVGGVVTGQYLMNNQQQQQQQQQQLSLKSDKIEPEESKARSSSTEFTATKFIENKKSAYGRTGSVPFTLHVYQYDACPYCAQVRAYLDYFGYSYHLTEVDSWSKQDLTKFTKARDLPIVVITQSGPSSYNGNNKRAKRWHLGNATQVLSALESLRNDKRGGVMNDTRPILDLYLPVLKGNVINHVKSPYKYHVSNSNLNSTEWRKWINNVAVPVFRLNSIRTLSDTFELFDHYAERSRWTERYNPVKLRLVYYTNALRTFYSQRPVIQEQISSKSSREPRKLLYDTVAVWEKGLKDNKFMSGRDEPDLADISMYGNVKAYEGCSLFRDMIGKHTKMRKWYQNMTIVMHKGYHNHNTIHIEKKQQEDSKPKSGQDDTSRSGFFGLEKLMSIQTSQETENRQEQEYEQKKPSLSSSSKPNNNNNNNNNTRTVESASRSVPQQEQELKLVVEVEQEVGKKGKNYDDTELAASSSTHSSTFDDSASAAASSDLLLFRVLTVNYLANLAAFAYARYNK